MVALGIQLFSALTKPELSITGFKIAAWILTFCAYTTYHLARKPISVAKAALNCNSTNTNCTSWPPFDGENAKDLLAGLDSAYLFAYAIGMFISGHIAERSNVRYFLTLGMLGSGLFTAMFGVGRYLNIHNYLYYFGVQLIAGLLQSSGWPCVVASLANWFGKGRRGLVMGLWNAHTSVGNILGGVIGAAFVDYNWALTFIVPGVIIAAMGIIVFFFLVPYPAEVGLQLAASAEMGAPSSVRVVTTDKESPDKDAETNETTTTTISPTVGSINPDDQDPLLSESTAILSSDGEPEDTEAISLPRALCIPGVIEFSLCLFFAKLVSYTFLFWLPLYIANVDHYSKSKSADIATVFDFGGIIGSVTAGLISDITRGPGTVCVVSFILAVPALLIYQSVHVQAHQFAFSFLMLLICGALVNGPYGLITTAVSADLGSHESLRGSTRALATVTAIIDGTGSIGAAIGPLLAGPLSKLSWSYVFYMLIFSDVCAMLCMTRVVLKEVRHWIVHGLA